MLRAEGEAEGDVAADGEPAAAAPEPDQVIQNYEEHEDAVYGCEWSAADPWTFASLSCDGRFIVNHVPTETKYRILL